MPFAPWVSPACWESDEASPAEESPYAVAVAPPVTASASAAVATAVLAVLAGPFGIAAPRYSFHSEAGAPQAGRSAEGVAGYVVRSGWTLHVDVFILFDVMYSLSVDRMAFRLVVFAAVAVGHPVGPRPVGPRLCPCIL